MLKSISKKDGTILYHIEIVLGCHATNGVIGCGQPTCWLTDIGLLTKLSCIRACSIGTPTQVASVHYHKL